jgi:glycosyltransferase involved in cell wall biosynthesis
VVDRKSRVILTSSHNAGDLLVTEFGCLAERVQTVPDGVDAEAFYPPAEGEKKSLAERRASLKIPPGRKVVVYLGLLAGYQGTDALLEAAAKLLQVRDDVHLLIMGFPSVECYRHKAQQLGIASHTTFTGKIPYDQARNYLALGDVAVAPKLSATEGSGKILNYMAMGLPTVAFETPVSREYLGAEGIYAARGNAASLAEALLFSLSDQNVAGRGKVLRRMAIDAHTWDHAAQTIVGAYRLVCP